MSLFATMLYPERFIPPQGIIRLIQDEEVVERFAGVEKLKQRIYELVCEGYELDTDIAKAVDRSENSVRTYLNNLLDEGLIKKITPSGSGKGVGPFKRRFYPIDHVVDMNKVMDSIKPRKRTSPDKARIARANKARMEYMTALNRNWISTPDLAKKLGKVRTTVSKMLGELQKEGIVEFRALGDAPQNGYEWRKK